MTDYKWREWSTVTAHVAKSAGKSWIYCVSVLTKDLPELAGRLMDITEEYAGNDHGVLVSWSVKNGQALAYQYAVLDSDGVDKLVDTVKEYRLE
jgi:hypothetical protein